MSLAPTRDIVPLFPGEITDTIIDHLHNDYTALRACALVSHAWLPSSRHHLFEVFTGSPEKSPLTDLLDYLTSTPEVSCHIRHFVLEGYRGISLKNIAAVLHALPNVRIVELEKLFISSPVYRDPPPTPAIELSALRISGCNVTEHDLDPLFLLLHLFTVVRTLRLEENSNLRFMHFGRVPATRAVSAPDALQVTELSLACLLPSLVGELVRPTRMAHWETLRSLELDDCITGWEQVIEVGKLLAEIGPRLRRLSLKPSPRLLPHNDHLVFPPGGMVPGVPWNQNGVMNNAGGREIDDNRSRWAPLNLAKCTNLDEFVFNLHYGTQSPLYDVHAFFKLNVDLLSTIAGTVGCVKSRIVPAYPYRGLGAHAPGAATGGPLQAMDWPLLDETLSDARFLSPRVVLDVTELERQFTKSDFDALKAFLTGSLYRIRRRGALVFEVNQGRVWRGDVFLERF